LTGQTIFDLEVNEHSVIFFLRRGVRLSLNSVLYFPSFTCEWTGVLIESIQIIHTGVCPDKKGRIDRRQDNRKKVTQEL